MILVMLGGFSLFSIETKWLSLLLASLFALFLIINCFILKKKERNYKFHVLLLILLIIATILSYLYFNVFRSIEERESVIEAEIFSISHTEYSTCYGVRCIEVDGVPKNVDLVLYADKNLKNFEIGDVIVTKVSIRKLNRDAQEDLFYFRNGFVGIADHISDDIALARHNPHTLQRIIITCQNAIHDYIYKIMGKEGGGLFLALIIGDKSLLSGALTLDFNRIGISHILALSGQHLAILSLLVDRLFSLCRINKKWRLSILCILVVAYMALTGFTPSVTRAGLMLIFSALAFLLGNSYDISTGLFTSVFLFVLIQPYAITDISLLLSAFATFGVIQAMIWMEEHKTKNKGILCAIISSVLVSLFAMLYTSFLVVSNFSYISILSPLTSLIFSFLVEIYIYAGLVLCVLGSFLPIQAISTLLFKCIQLPAHFFSSFHFVYFSSEFLLCTIFSILLIIGLLVYLLYPIRHKKSAFAILASLCICIYLSAIIGTVSATHADNLVYLQNEEENQESFLLKERGEITYIDVLPSSNAFIETTQKLSHENIAEIHRYVLMGYQDETISYLERVLKNIKVYALYLPKPVTDNERFYYADISALAQEHGIALNLFEPMEYLSFAQSRIYITQINSPDNASLPIFTVEFKGRKHMYLAQGCMDNYSYDPIMELMHDCESVIYGAKGIKGQEFLNISYLPSKIQTLIVSNENNYVDEDFLKIFTKSKSIFFCPKRVSLAE